MAFHERRDLHRPQWVFISRQVHLFAFSFIVAERALRVHSHSFGLLYQYNSLLIEIESRSYNKTSFGFFGNSSCLQRLLIIIQPMHDAKNVLILQYK